MMLNDVCATSQISDEKSCLANVGHLYNFVSLNNVKTKCDKSSMDGIPNMDLRLLPPSRTGLYKYAQRACIQGDWINRECRNNVLVQDPRNWGWEKPDVFLPEWQDLEKKRIEVHIQGVPKKQQDL